VTTKQAFRRFVAYHGYLVIQYICVAGLAWYWVLGLQFPIWKAVVIGVLQSLCALIGGAIFPRGYKSEGGGK
jgi:hypothetical protein